MIQQFFSSFTLAAGWLAAFAGVVAAGLAFLALLALAGLIFSALFHAATSWLVRRWRASGKPPTGRIAQILLRNGRSV